MGIAANEFEQVKGHAEMGDSILARNRWLMLARDCAVSHHENWDGTGYPYGRKGEDIPLIGRLVAVTDVFDVLTHRRPYKEAWPLEQAVTEIEQGAGSKFDPKVVAAFLRLHDEGKLLALL